MRPPNEANDAPAALRIAMIGDFPRSSSEVGGGVESVMLYLSRELVKIPGLELSVVTLDRWGLGPRTVESDGFRVHYLQPSRLRTHAQTLRNVQAMTQRLKGLAPELVHAHIAGPYADAARRSGLPWILTLHGIRFLEARLRSGLVNRTYRRWLVTRQERRSVRSAPHLISINPFVDQCFRAHIRGRVFPIENPVDDIFFDLEQANEPFSLLHVGRLTPRKDLMTLLKAFRSLGRRLTQARLRLAGAWDVGDPGGYGRSLQRFVAEHGLEDRVDFLGQVDEQRLLHEYARASVVVLSATLETAPMAITEAMAAATAVVSTDAGGSRHLITQGKTGRVVPCGDPDVLAGAIADTLGSDGRALAAGLEGRRAAEERFRARRVAERTIDAYRSVLAGPTR